MIGLKGEIDESITIVGYFNTPPSMTDETENLYSHLSWS